MSAALAASACGAPSQPGSSEADAAPRARAAKGGAPHSLHGRWQILEVNGAPARPSTGRRDEQPSVSFTERRYGGSSGCNGFGGHGVLVGDRWYAEPPMATMVGCGDLLAQERAIYGILAGGPTVRWESADVAVLRTASGALRLRRTGPAPEDGQAQTPIRLAGTRWDLGALDGRAVDLPGARQPARLGFEADRWTLETPCATVSGAWRQQNGAVALEAGTPTPRPCPAGLAATSDALAQAVTGSFRYATGPNGEFVLGGGGGHWLTARRDVTLDREEPHLLTGRWRIVSVDGRRPPEGERPADLAFGPGAFAVWDGCRHSEGVAIAYERQLHTHGSGMVTMANCPRDEIRATINRVVASGPRIAKTSEGGVALVSAAGTLRLERLSRQAFGTSVETRLRSGWAFDLPAPPAGRARLTIGPSNRFALALPCGTMTGRWRSARWAGGTYARFGADRPAPECADDPAAARLYNFFTGDVLSAVGPNRDIALFVNRDQALAARVAPEIR